MNLRDAIGSMFNVKPRESVRASAITPAEISAASQELYGRPSPGPQPTQGGPEQPAEAEAAAPAMPLTFETRFKRAPYYPLPFVPTINRTFIEEVARRTGVEIFTKKEREILGQLSARHEAAHKGLGEVSRDSVRYRLSDLIHSNERAIAVGDTPSPISTHAEMELEAQSKRAALRGELRAVGSLTIPILKDICARMSAAAEKVAIALDEEESAAADRWGMTHVPSAQLKIVVWLALDGFQNEVENAAPGSIFSPDTMLWGALSHRH